MAVVLDGWGGNQAIRARVQLVEPYAFTKISALGVEEKRTNVVAEFADAPQELGDGYRVNAHIVAWAADKVTKLPASALFRCAEASCAFAVENGRAERRTVTIGHRNAQEAEVLAGLAAGETVIRHPSNTRAYGENGIESAAGIRSILDIVFCSHHEEEAIMPMHLNSPAISQDHLISRRHTCDGTDVSPPLSWSGVPAGAKSLALIVDDPDAPDPAAPQRTFVHWVVYNIPPNAGGLSEGAAQALPPGALQGLNDWRDKSYGGPCPPIGRHRYFFKLYALDTVLELKRPTKAAVEEAMQGHILDRAELIGLYQR